GDDLDLRSSSEVPQQFPYCLRRAPGGREAEFCAGIELRETGHQDDAVAALQLPQIVKFLQPLDVHPLLLRRPLIGHPSRDEHLKGTGAEPLSALADEQDLSLLLHTADTAPDEPERIRESIIVPLSADPDDSGSRPRGRERGEAVLHLVEGGIPEQSVRSAAAGNDSDEA